MYIHLIQLSPDSLNDDIHENNNTKRTSYIKTPKSERTTITHESEKDVFLFLFSHILKNIKLLKKE